MECLHHGRGMSVTEQLGKKTTQNKKKLFLLQKSMQLAFRRAL